MLKMLIEHPSYKNFASHNRNHLFPYTKKNSQNYFHFGHRNDIGNEVDIIFRDYPKWTFWPFIINNQWYWCDKDMFSVLYKMCKPTLYYEFISQFTLITSLEEFENIINTNTKKVGRILWDNQS